MASIRRQKNCFTVSGCLSVALLCIIMSSGAAADTIIYGGNAYDRADVIAINLTTPAARRVDDLLFDTQAMDQDPLTGRVYYFEFGSANTQLAYWDPADGTNTIVRAYDMTPWGYSKRAAFGPDGLLYLIDDDDMLYRFDVQTGDYQYSGQVRGIQPGYYFSGTGDIAFSPDGMLYLVTHESLYEIDPETLRATLLHSDMLPGTSWLVWTGLAFCDGTLFASDVNVRTGRSAVYRIDRNSGAVTRLIDTGTLINDLTSCPVVAGGVNLPPVLYPIGNRSVDIGDTLVFTVSATDPNPGDELTFTADGLPDNATFDPVTRRFSWQPNADQEGDHEVTFIVEDAERLRDSETIIIAVVAPKSGCGAAPMVRKGGLTGLMKRKSAWIALLPLLPSLALLGMWWIIVRIRRRRKNR
jgi:hypothetical protein